MEVRVTWKPEYWYFLAAVLFGISAIIAFIGDDIGFGGLWIVLGALMLAAGLRRQRQ